MPDAMPQEGHEDKKQDSIRDDLDIRDDFDLRDDRTLSPIFLRDDPRSSLKVRDDSKMSSTFLVNG